MASRRSSTPLRRFGGARGLTVAVGCVALLVVSACSSSSSKSNSSGSAASGSGGGSCSTPNKSPITVSVVADLSGQSPTLITHGKGTVAAATTAVNIANTTGGIDCHPIKLKVHDAAASPTGVSQAFRAAIDDKPVAITGFTFSGILAGSVPLVSQAKIPYMGTSPVFAGVANLPFFYSTQLANSVLGADSVEALKRQMGGSLQGKRVAAEGSSNSATTDEFLAAIKQGVEAAGGTYGPVFRDSTSFTEWSSQAVNTVSSKADALITSMSDATMITIADALKTANFSGKLVNLIPSTDRVFKQINNTPSFSSLRVTNFPTEGTPLAQAVTAAGASLSDANGSFYFGQEFAAATFLVAVLRKCGATCSTDAFVKTVTDYGPFTVPLNGLFGPMTFNKTVAVYPASVASLASSGQVELVGGTLSS